MYRYHNVFILVAGCIGLSAAYAATPINLHHQPTALMRFFAPSYGAAVHAVQLKETNRNVDTKQTLHVRLQETYMGHPVWGADAVLHIQQCDQTTKSLARLAAVANTPNSDNTMDGILYQDLATDLNQSPAFALSTAQAQKALQHGIDHYQHDNGNKPLIRDKHSELIVFVDKSNKAHWAYKVSFTAEPDNTGQLLAQPHYIMDAVSFYIYQQWNNIKTQMPPEASFGGGFGGNEKMGKLIYDGASDHLPKLNIERDPETKFCYLQNEIAVVAVWGHGTLKLAKFPCDINDSAHNNVFWDGDWDAINGGYSPSNDVLFAGSAVNDMYHKWYHTTVLTDAHGKPLIMTMIVHAPGDNAYWDGWSVTLGDGMDRFYPLTSLGIIAHEVSHGFTERHSNLAYYGQSGGMNESFSDMAAQAAEFFVYGHNTWQIGPEVVKEKGVALRYMDEPSQDCGDRRMPGQRCSINTASQYYDGLGVHYSSGVYNRFFYLLSTSRGWDVKKAFSVMVQANANYWTSTTNFVQGACGVIKASKSLGYSVSAVKRAFRVIDIDTQFC